MVSMADIANCSKCVNILIEGMSVEGNTVEKSLVNATFILSTLYILSMVCKINRKKHTVHSSGKKVKERIHHDMDFTKLNPWTL